MTKDYSTETHLSKDELLQILNEIDSEQQNDRKTTHDQPNGIDPHHRHPNPSNPFF